jgi:hypothetical protein
MSNAQTIAKFYNKGGSKHATIKVFADLRSCHGKWLVDLTCQCGGADCAHQKRVMDFLKSGVQTIGSRFKIYPATLQFLYHAADTANVSLILDEIKARKAGVEATIKPKVLTPGIMEGYAKAEGYKTEPAPKPAPPAPKMPDPLADFAASEAPKPPKAKTLTPMEAAKVGGLAIDLD